MPTSATLKTVMVPMARLVLDPANARKHSLRNLNAIKGSLRRFGQQRAIVIDANDVIRAGNGTFLAARELGWEEIACVRTKLQGTEATAYSVADNRSSELAEWDDPALATILMALEADEVDLEDLGFDDGEYAAILKAAGVGRNGDGDGDDADDSDEPPPPLDQAAALRIKWQVEPGQLWVIPSQTDPSISHRILCGDAGDPLAVSRLMDGETASLLVTSPPYANQRTYRGAITDWDTLMQRVFAVVPMADDGQLIVNLGLYTEDREWVEFWRDWFAWMNDRGWLRIGWYVWDQRQGLPGETYGRLRRCHEFLFHFARTIREPALTVPCTDSGRVYIASGLRGPEGIGQRAGGRTNEWVSDTHRVHDSVFHVARHNIPHTIENIHPAVYPPKLVREILPIWPGLVYDPFGGSGTTLVAAEQERMPCRMMELAPEYVAVTLERVAAIGLSPRRI